MANTGFGLNLYTTKEELNNAKNGVSTIVAWTKEQRGPDAVYHVSASVDICDILEKEVRVNVSKSGEQFEGYGKVLGEAMGKELERVFKNIIE